MFVHSFDTTYIYVRTTEAGNPWKPCVPICFAWLLLFDWGSMTIVSGQITKLLVEKYSVSATRIDHPRRQHAGFWAAKHGHSQLLLDSKFLVEVQSSRILEA